jgi:glycosyltransferase involved in cell wall biosynthesis
LLAADRSPAMSDVRWFGQNEYEHLVVPTLQQLGLRIDTSGPAQSKVAVVMNHDLAPAAWRYAHRHRIPLVSYVWDLPPFRLGEGRADHVAAWRGHLFRVPRLRHRYTTRRGYYSRLQYVATHAAAVWTPSIASAGDVARRFRVEAVPVPYCYNSSVFTTDLRSQGSRNPRAGQRPILLSISRLTSPKNHAAVLRAGARLRAHVEIIGRGPTQPALAALAARLGVSCRIRSGLSADEIVASYRQASVVVCPSRFEGLGLTGIEAAICGTPVAASDIPAHREFLGLAAEFFALDDDDSLIAAINRARAADAPPTAHFAHLTIEAAAQRFCDRLQRFL